MYADKILTCADCGQAFTFTASEQEFYANRQFSDPRRRSSCRAARKAQRDKAIQAAKDTLSEINAIGVQVKDLDIGLLDFPCLVDGEIVLLCWKLGEPTISHWHGTEEGFAGRKPIDERMSGE